MTDVAQIRLSLRVNLAAEIVEWHKERGGKDIRFMFYLSVFGLPVYDIILATFDAFGMRKAMEQIVTEFMAKREIDAPDRCNVVIVDDTPSLLASWRTKKSAVEAWEGCSLDHREGVVRKSLMRKLPRNQLDVYRETVGGMGSIQ